MASAAVKEAFKYDCKEVLKRLKSDDEKGLSKQEVLARQEQYGKNELPAAEPTPFLTLVLKQFEDMLVLILLGAAFTSFVLALFENAEDRLTAFVEPAVILVILIANATVGVIQETNAEKSIEALRKSEAHDTIVLRDGSKQTIHASELVPGDIIFVNEGDKVPADSRVLRIETATLTVDEALLTGESLAVHKETKPLANAKVAAEKRNMIFMGTLVDRGKAVAVVTETGSNTEMGDIAIGLQKDENEEKTPLQQKLDEFGEQLSKVIGVICLVVWLINIGHFTDPAHGGVVRGAIYYFKIAVALAVAAIPEGLPAVVTTCLALGTLKMAKKNAIVRSLPSVETLGCTTVICSDKTGTLTTNQMSVQHVVTVQCIDDTKQAQFGLFRISGDSYAPYGDVTDSDNKVIFSPSARNASLAEISKIAVLCNESDLHYSEEDEKKGTYTKSGTATEAALKVLAEKLGVPDAKESDQIFKTPDPRIRVKATNNYFKQLYKREHLLEFDRNRKSMSVVVKEVTSSSRLLFVKGAPESIWNRCDYVQSADGKAHPLTPHIRQQLNDICEQLASEGLRCLALASRRNVDPNADFVNMENYANIESGLTFVGMVCMLDPPRAGVDTAIAKCARAGIRVIVITGDSPATAVSICRRVGVFGVDEDVQGKFFTGEQFSQMSDQKKNDAVQSASLFCRVEPKHKTELVQLLKTQGEITAMTGDGVNDAPALKAAHIGIAMGSGTDVAREASDMVLQDDNFATIVMAVEEGRAIFANTKQFIRYLISSNIGEVACIFLTAAIGMPEALIPVQLLWVNLVTDGLPATALGFNPPDKDVMERPPRGRDDAIINGWMFFRYFAVGTYVGIGTVLGFIWWYLKAESGPQITWTQLTAFHSCGQESAQAVFSSMFDRGLTCDVFHDAHPSTVSLSILVTIEMFNAINALSENQSLLVVPPWSNFWVIAAVLLSFALHFMIVYIPWAASIFHVAPLNYEEWSIVFWLSLPVVFLDETLKFLTRLYQGSPSSKRQKKY